MMTFFDAIALLIVGGVAGYLIAYLPAKLKGPAAPTPPTNKSGGGPGEEH